MSMEEIRELIENRQYTRLRQELAEQQEADVAAALEELPGEEMIKVFRILPKTMAADVFAYLSIETEQMIITALTDREAANIINNLMADDATDLMEEMLVHAANCITRPLLHGICCQFHAHIQAQEEA